MLKVQIHESIYLKHRDDECYPEDCSNEKIIQSNVKWMTLFYILQNKMRIAFKNSHDGCLLDIKKTS